MIGGTIEMQRIMNLQIIVFIILCISRWYWWVVTHALDIAQCPMHVYGWLHRYNALQGIVPMLWVAHP